VAAAWSGPLARAISRSSSASASKARSSSSQRSATVFDEAEVKLLSELAANLSLALERGQQQQRIDYLAYYDILTGCRTAGSSMRGSTRRSPCAMRRGSRW
jgi:GAF domain-containing protein